MKSAFILAALFSVSAFAGTEVQFDVQAMVTDSSTSKVFTYEHTYQAEFQPAGDDVKAAYSELLSFRDNLPLVRPSTGEALAWNFGILIEHLVKVQADGKAYNVDIDFGPGQPLNDHTRWSTTYLRTLDSLVGFSINGEEITYPNAAIVEPVLRIRNFKIIN